MFFTVSFKSCYKTYFFIWIICRNIKSPYLCNVFFIVLDLRLTKVGARRCSFFYVHTFNIRNLLRSINLFRSVYF